MDKKYDRLKNNPKDVTFKELKTILESYGFIFTNYSGGSHFTVSYKIKGIIDPMEKNSIPFHKPTIKAYYVKIALKWIERVIANEQPE
jgi:hypothetical protein